MVSHAAGFLFLTLWHGIKAGYFLFYVHIAMYVQLQENVNTSSYLESLKSNVKKGIDCFLRTFLFMPDTVICFSCLDFNKLKQVFVVAQPMLFELFLASQALKYFLAKKRLQ